jgi:hypothetical protein
MKRIILLALVIVFSVMMAGAASAVPRLQTYIVASGYQDIYQQGSTANYDKNVIGSWNLAPGGSIAGGQFSATGCFSGGNWWNYWGNDGWRHHRGCPGSGPGTAAPEPGTLSLLGLGLLGMIPILRRKKD